MERSLALVRALQRFKEKQLISFSFLLPRWRMCVQCLHYPCLHSSIPRRAFLISLPVSAPQDTRCCVLFCSCLCARRWQRQTCCWLLLTTCEAAWASMATSWPRLRESIPSLPMLREAHCSLVRIAKSLGALRVATAFSVGGTLRKRWHTIFSPRSVPHPGASTGSRYHSFSKSLGIMPQVLERYFILICRPILIIPNHGRTSLISP